MFIRNCLSEKIDLVTLNKNDTIEHAVSVLQKNNLKSVPVVDDEGKFVGILSKEGMFELFETGLTDTLDNLKKQPIEKAITRIKPLSLDSKFEETLPIIVRFPFVPIVGDNGKLLGIVKRKAITNSLESSFGVGVPGIRVLIGTAEMEGRLGKILEITRNMHLNVITAVAFDAGEHFNRRVLLKTEKSDKKEELLNRLESNGFNILTVHED